MVLILHLFHSIKITDRTHVYKIGMLVTSAFLHMYVCLCRF